MRKTSCRLLVFCLPFCLNQPLCAGDGVFMKDDMFRRAFAGFFGSVSAVGLLIAADAPNENASKKDVEKLQGTWQMIALEVFGQGRAFRGPKEEVELEKVIIKGDNWTLRREKALDKNGIERKETQEQARYVLDATKKPKTIDLAWTDGELKRKTYPGVYLLEGGMLTVCYARESTERPTGFTAEATTQIKGHCVLMVLTRVKPKLPEGSLDRRELQGTWRVIEMQTAGIAAPKGMLEKVRLFCVTLGLTSAPMRLAPWPWVRWLSSSESPAGHGSMVRRGVRRLVDE